MRLCLRSPPALPRVHRGGRPSLCVAGRHPLKKKKVLYVHSTRWGGGLHLRADAAPAPPQTLDLGQREGKRVFMVSDTPCSDGKGNPYFTTHPPQLCVNRPSLSPTYPRATPTPSSLVMQIQSAPEAQWEESAVAQPLPCWPNPTGLLGLWPEGFFISICACDRAGLECEQ